MAMKVLAPAAWKSSSKITASLLRKPSTAMAFSPSWAATPNRGGTPMPPPTSRVRLLLSTGKPLPRGAKISMVLPGWNWASSAVPWPRIWNTKRRVPAVLSMPQMEMGRRRVWPGTRIWANWPGWAIAARAGASSTKSNTSPVSCRTESSLQGLESYFMVSLLSQGRTIRPMRPTISSRMRMASRRAAAA